MESRLIAAVSDFFDDNCTLSRAQLARKHDVPRSTLYHRTAGRKSVSEAWSERGLLTEEEEEALASAVLRLIELHWAPQLRWVRSMAHSLLVERLGDDCSPPGKNWVRRYINRRPELTSTWSKRLISVRADAAANESVIVSFLERLKMLREAHDITSHRLFNVDEKGFVLGNSASARVVVRAGFTARDKEVRNPGNRDFCSTIACVSAESLSLPPLIIFKGETTQANWASSGRVPDGKS